MKIDGRSFCYQIFSYSSSTKAKVDLACNASMAFGFSILAVGGFYKSEMEPIQKMVVGVTGGTLLGAGGIVKACNHVFYNCFGTPDEEEDSWELFGNKI